MKTLLSTHHEIIFESKLNEVLGFIKTRCSLGTPSGEMPTGTTNIDKVLFKIHLCRCFNRK